MVRAYGARAERERAPVGTGAAALIAVVVSSAVATGWSIVTISSVVLVVVLGRGRGLLVIVAVGCAVTGVWRAEAAWTDLQPRELGEYQGWALVADDPQPYAASTRVLLQIEGERFESWHRGRAVQIRVSGWRAGERVHVSGTRRALDPVRAQRVAWQHVVGEFRLEWASDVDPGRPIDRASNRVRAAIERGAATLPGDDGALFRGLVVGDDRDQPFEMIQRFRASGLSHLTAVSGQNVSFVLAAAGPLLVRLRPGWRWAATVGLIAWFVSLTRFEPSIVRAGVMAAFSATGFALGRERSPFRLLCWAVTGLLLVDPLLAWSVGFWLSVGATAGVTTIGPWLGARLGRGGPVSTAVGVTLGAQAGVVVPAMLVFGRLPLVSIPANLLAVPVAGFVMLYGLPAGLIAGVASPIAPIVMLPCRVGVRWVDTVAALGDRFEPGGVVTWIGWTLVVALVVAVAATNGGDHGRASVDR